MYQYVPGGGEQPASVRCGWDAIGRTLCQSTLCMQWPVYIFLGNWTCYSLTHTHISAQPEQSSVQNRKATIEGRKRKQNFKNSPLWPSRFRIQVKNGILLGMNVLWRQQKCLERKAGGTGFANILLYKVVRQGKIEARLTNHTATEPQSQTNNQQASSNRSQQSRSMPTGTLTELKPNYHNTNRVSTTIRVVRAIVSRFITLSMDSR